MSVLSVRQAFNASFYIVEFVASYAFEIVHSDVWTSLDFRNSSFKSYLMFLDQFSHYQWVSPVKYKSGVFENFVQFRYHLKNQFQYDIKYFQCDDGGEYNNTQLHNLFTTNGIQMHFFCSYSS